MTRNARSRHAMRLAAAARAGDRGRASYFAALGKANVGRAAAIREHAGAQDHGATPKLTHNRDMGR